MNHLCKGADTKMKGILLNPGSFFDGYTIKEYNDPISADEIIYIPEGYIKLIDNSNNKEQVSRRLLEARKSAIEKLKQKAKDCNCNGIIGFSCNYLTFEPSNRILSNYFFCIIASGTPVVIENKQ